jgi:hypothetical protein
VESNSKVSKEEEKEMKITRRKLKYLIRESSGHIHNRLINGNMPIELQYILEDFVYNYLTFFIKPRFKSIMRFYEHLHNMTDVYSQKFSKYFVDFGDDALHILSSMGVKEYSDQISLIEQYFVDNWETIMSRVPED